jgi:hypothetical protein
VSHFLKAAATGSMVEPHHNRRELRVREGVSRSRPLGERALGIHPEDPLDQLAIARESDPGSQMVTAPAAAADTAIVVSDTVVDESLITELERGERLLWSGRPDTSRWLVPNYPLRLELSLGAGAFFLVLAAIIETSALRSGGFVFGLFVSILGVLPAAVGLYLIPGRVIARRYFGRRTAYGLTTLRALVIKPTWQGGRQTAFVWLASGPAVSQRIRRDGHGTVMIGATIYQQAAWFAGDPGWFLYKPWERPRVAFWNIADAAEVSRLAARLISEAQTVS